jgi:hypothetical protein
MGGISVNKYSGLLSYETPKGILEFVREDIEQLSDVILLGANPSVVRLDPDRWDWKFITSGKYFELFDKTLGIDYTFTIDDVFDISDYRDSFPDEYIASYKDFQ